MQRAPVYVESFVERLYLKIKKNKNGNAYLRNATLAYLADNDVEFHVDGGLINPGTQKLIESAETEVLMQFYKFDHTSDAGYDIKQALVNLNNNAKRNIDVKILINLRAGPAAWLTSTYPDPFEWIKSDAGGRYIVIDGEKKYLNKLNIECRLHKHFFFNSYHSKQIIIDRKKLMLRSGDVYPDTNYKNGQQLRNESASTISNPTLATSAANSYIARFNGRYSKIESFSASEDNPNQSPVLLLEKNPSTNPFKKIFNWSPYKIAVTESIRFAKNTIKIVTPNLNDPDIVNELIKAIKRGIKVSVLIGKYHNTDGESKPTMGGTNLNTIKRMFASTPINGLKNLDVRWATGANFELLQDKQAAAMHRKGIVVDDKILIAGSSPLDKQAMYYSGESDFVVESSKIAKEFLGNAFDSAFKDAKPLIDETLINMKKRVSRALSVRFDFRENSHILFKRKDFSSKTELKSKCISQLIESINRADSLKDINCLLANATKVSPDNPLAFRRGIHLFAKPDSVTKTISIEMVQSVKDEFFANNHASPKCVY